MRKPSYWNKAKKYLSKKDKVMKKLILTYKDVTLTTSFGLLLRYAFQTLCWTSKNTLDILIQESDKLDDFAIISPLSSNETFPNYKIFKKENISQDIFEVDRVDGFSMLLNKEKFDNKFFDENIFLYLENDDLCLWVKKKKEKIYIIRKSRIDHLGSSSSSDNKSKDFEYLRNWHWMWSKFYFNKKHSGYLISIIKIFPNLISASLKFFLYFILFQAHKKNIYKMRILGIYNSLIGKKSYYRIF